jgi:hypothetical protein
VPFHPRKIVFEAGKASYAGRVIATLSVDPALREEAGLDDAELEAFFRDELDRLVGAGRLDGAPRLHYGWVAGDGEWTGTDGAERLLSFRALQAHRRGDDLL